MNKPKLEHFYFKEVFIASDHAGFDAKLEVIEVLSNLNVKYTDLGPQTSKTSVDYPKFAKKVVQKIQKVPESAGILICGSGTGMQIAANKFENIRAAFSFDQYSAKMARSDNNANILTLRARQFDTRKYKKIVETFLKTPFSQEDRHKKRINLLEN